MPSSRKSSTSSSPYLRTVTELSTIVEELREIKNRPIAPQPDIAAAERRLHEYIDAMLPGAVDAGTGHVFDDLIDAYVDEWCAAGFRHHNQVLADLDIIAAQLEAQPGRPRAAGLLGPAAGAQHRLRAGVGDAGWPMTTCRPPTRSAATEREPEP